MGDSGSKKVAYVNYILIAWNIICFIDLEIAGSTEDLNFMIRRGAMFIPRVLEDKEYYRLLTSTFMHFGIRHLANNMLVLYVFGDHLERALGRVKYLLLYLCCGIGANLISMLISLRGPWQLNKTVGAGASGAIFGVIGGLLYAVIINRGKLEDLTTRQLIVMIIFSLCLGILNGGVDNSAHIAGLVIGILLAVILYRKPKPNSLMGEEFWDHRY